MTTNDSHPRDPAAESLEAVASDDAHRWIAPSEPDATTLRSDPEHAPAVTPRLPRVRSRALVLGALVSLGAAAGAGVTEAVTRHPTSTAQRTTDTAPQFNNAANQLPGGDPAGGVTAPGTGPVSGGAPSGANTSSEATSSNQSDGPTDAASIASAADAGIVDITTTIVGGKAAGTGMVLTSTGEILTNNHVIDGATSISVRDVGNGKTSKATVVGYDRTEDVAVIQLVKASGLTTVKTVSSEPGKGTAVVGVGNAGGTGGTPTYAGGSIIGVDKTITASDESDGTSEKLTGLLRTDAAIQAGDSRGPLLDTAGEVIGMDTAASSIDGAGFGPSTSTARSFAIPILTALSITEEIESGSSSSTVHIGASAVLGIYVSEGEQSSGARVEKVKANGAAAAAGITRGDTITSVDGVTVRNADKLTNELTTLTPGQTVSVTYTTSSGTRRAASVKLGTGSPQ